MVVGAPLARADLLRFGKQRVNPPLVLNQRPRPHFCGGFCGDIQLRAGHSRSAIVRQLGGIG
ncbi:MAG: hypothetical protein KDJ70_17370 [Candidatus Competibacteraceae bacterium]|nr:hypothetical protein [Candidatus Competibacteraceae bacterium]